MSQPWHLRSAADLGRALRRREVTSVELTKYFLNRIDALDPKIHSYLVVTKDLAISQAQRADAMIQAGEGTLLTGVPFAHKDLFCTKGVRTTAGSRMLANFIPPYDATVTQKMYDAGMVLLGKTNMDEFAMGSATNHSYFGPTSNPFDLNRVPGGSSGGSAAALAAGLAPISTGSDTGGSIRQPASYCHLVGIKPTYGRISRYGMIAFASSLDQAGVFAHTTEDAALLLSILCGVDEKDSTSSYEEVPDFSKSLESNQLYRIAVPSSFFAALDSEGQAEFRRVLTTLEQMGHTVSWIDLPIQDYVIPTYYTIAPAEASSNLARYDGVRYGHRHENAHTLEELYSLSRTEGFGEEVKRRILMGTYVLSAGYYDAYYQKALLIRQHLKQVFAKTFESFDIIATPTTLSAAFLHNAHDTDPVAMYYSDLCTVSVNLADLPGISIPVMQHQGLPFGLQLIGRPFDEATLLNCSAQIERALPWHSTHSPIAMQEVV